MRYWGIVPAAGRGTRMGESIPKQYLSLKNKTILEHTLNCLLTYPRFEKIIVPLNKEDIFWSKLSISKHPKIFTTIGGVERCHSVLNALKILEKDVNNDDWVLVHDAVRPCLQHDDIDKLITALFDHDVGGLLGAPISCTVKQVNRHNQVISTLDRTELWQAFTPQMFRFGILYQALQSAIEKHQLVTDEAMAVELMGATPLIIQGCSDNIKITNPNDLMIAESLLLK